MKSICILAVLSCCHIKCYCFAYILGGNKSVSHQKLFPSQRSIVEKPWEPHRERSKIMGASREHRVLCNMASNCDSNPERFHVGDDLVEAPTVQNIIKFAIPAIGIWLCGPLLSLIDTSAVGMLSGTAQLAALNPAITITDDGALLVSFMYTAATSIVAAAVEKDRQSQGNLTSLTIATALQLAMIVGTIFGVGLGGSSRFFVNVLLGNSVNDAALISAATNYVKIRALGMPAAVLIGTAQSACLGMKDNRSPLVVMIAAALVNLIGDIILVSSLGSAGAAWATVMSQYAALIMFIKWLNAKPLNFNTNEKGSSATRGILYGHFKVSDLFKMPQPQSTGIAQKFWEYVVPVTTTAIGRISGYVAMSHVVCFFGTADMAAQQILLAFFLCFVPMCDSLNLTAQSFVPGIHELSANVGNRSKLMKQTVENFLKAGTVFGFVMALIASCMPFASRVCTRDPAVIASVASCTPSLAIYCALSGVVCAGEGLLLAQKDLKFLKNSFSIFFFAVPFFLLRLKKSVLDGVQQVGLKSAWGIFAGYQVIRSAMWILRVRQLLIRDET